MTFLTFATPLLLIGLLAAAIPPLLHLLSSARAKQVPFPTLRFLRLSMEKTARRRKVQQWLLMAVRCGLLALLAVGVAEPITRAAGGWLSGAGGSAMIVLDNSMSMSAAAQESTRLASAKAQAVSLLEGPGRPQLAGVIPTNGGMASTELTASLDLLRKDLVEVEPSLGRAAMGPAVQAAATLLGSQTQGQGPKALYVFSDLQQVSFKELVSLPAGTAGGEIDVFIVNTAPRPSDNVGLSDLRVTGQVVTGAVLTFVADLINSGPAERIVNVSFQVDSTPDKPEARTARVSLAAGTSPGPGLRSPLGEGGSWATVRFQHRFDRPGLHTGKVAIEQDDGLPADNARHFCLSVADCVEALVVGGAGSAELAAGGEAAMLLLALDPFGDPNVPWPIRPRRLAAERFSAADLGNASVAFFCNVPSFSPTTASAVRQFVRTGGTAAFFLGPDVQAENYNRLLFSTAGQDGAFLPGKLEPAVGQIGPQAPAIGVDFVDVEHPYLAGLYENAADYRTVLVQRYFPLAVESAPARVLIRLADGQALLATKPYGRGAVVLCATSAGPQWSNLPLTGLFLPTLSRICLMSAAGGRVVESYLAGSAVVIQPLRPGGASKLPDRAVVRVTPPPFGDKTPEAVSVPLSGPPDTPQATFTATSRAGVYRWQVAADSADKVGPEGAFAVNADGAESGLAAMDAPTLREALVKAGWRNVFVGSSLAEVRSAAAARATGHNWWDLLAVMVIVLLVVEVILANRVRSRAAAATSVSLGMT